MKFEGAFARGVPSGPGTFTLCAHRLLDLDPVAAAHTLNVFGPTIAASGAYKLPPGAHPSMQKCLKRFGGAAIVVQGFVAFILKLATRCRAGSAAHQRSGNLPAMPSKLDCISVLTALP